MERRASASAVGGEKYLDPEWNGAGAVQFGAFPRLRRSKTAAQHNPTRGQSEPNEEGLFPKTHGLVTGIINSPVSDGARAGAGRSEAHSRSRFAPCDWGPVGGRQFPDPHEIN